MPSERTWTDEQLIAAIPKCHSWRGVLRELGLSHTSTASKKTAQKYADKLGLDYSHFTGQRSWSDVQLREAVKSLMSWTAVAESLGLASASSGTLSTLRSHALRLGLDTNHLARDAKTVGKQPGGPHPFQKPVTAEHLRDSAQQIASTWFSRRGYAVLVPSKPVSYDFAVESDCGLQKVQVKSTILPPGPRQVCSIDRTEYASNAAEKSRVLYDPSDFDFYFIVDVEKNCYLIPISTVAGKHSLSLSAYANFKV